MAARSYEAGFRKYYGDRLTNISDDTSDEEIRQVYDHWARDYDKDVVEAARGVYHKPLAECLEAVLTENFPEKAKDDLKIIDVGAGTGLIGTELQKLGYSNLHALDISPEMLKEAKKRNIYKRFFCVGLSDQQISEIQTGEFDALICAGTLLTGHIRAAAFEEMVRMVKHGGVICFNIRDNQLVDYQAKIRELEKAARWEMITKNVVSFFESEEMPRETYALLFRVLRK
ncbi:Methyltransferase domain [Porites harrisoni]